MFEGILTKVVRLIRNKTKAPFISTYDFIANYYYKHSKSYATLSKLNKYFNKANKPPDILYLGDSVLKNVSYDDTDKRTIEEMLKDDLPNFVSLASISHSAYHPGVYYSLLKAIQVMKRKPKIILLPVNVRSFSPQWDLHPNYQFETEINALEKYHQCRNINAIKLDRKTASSALFEAYDASPVHYPNTSLNRIGQFRLLVNARAETEEQKKFRLAHIFIFHYMHTLLPTHRKLTLLYKTLEILQEIDVSALIYTTPINYQAGNKYAGESFSEKIKSNIDVVLTVIEKRLDSNKFIFWDASMLLQSDSFVHSDIANEHLNQAGRSFLSSNLKTKTMDLYYALPKPPLVDNQKIDG